LIVQLSKLKEGMKGIVVKVSGGRGAVKRLYDMGLVPGAKIRIVRNALFRGPVEIEVKGSRLVIGRGLASRVLVSVGGSTS